MTQWCRQDYQHSTIPSLLKNVHIPVFSICHQNSQSLPRHDPVSKESVLSISWTETISFWQDYHHYRYWPQFWSMTRPSLQTITTVLITDQTITTGIDHRSDQFMLIPSIPGNLTEGISPMSPNMSSKLSKMASLTLFSIESHQYHWCMHTLSASPSTTMAMFHQVRLGMYPKGIPRESFRTQSQTPWLLIDMR